MTDTIQDLERRLRAAKAEEASRLAACCSCKGAGFISDTTYDRCGQDVACCRCHGTGLPEHRIRQIMHDAFTPFAKWPNKEASK